MYIYIMIFVYTVCFMGLSVCLLRLFVNFAVNETHGKSIKKNKTVYSKRERDGNMPCDANTLWTHCASACVRTVRRSSVE